MSWPYDREVWVDCEVGEGGGNWMQLRKVFIRDNTYFQGGLGALPRNGLMWSRGELMWLQNFRKLPGAPHFPLIHPSRHTKILVLEACIWIYNTNTHSQEHCSDPREKLLHVSFPKFRRQRFVELEMP